MAIRIGSNLATSLMMGTVPVLRAFLGTYQVWSNEVVVVLGSANTVNLKTLFTAAHWANPSIRKRVNVPSSATIGTTNASYAIATTTSADGQAGSFAGELILDVYGTVSGIGGAANSGKGGDVIWGNFPGRDGQKLIVNLHPGAIVRAGGGGGGKGGNGGGGSYQDDQYSAPAYSKYTNHWESQYVIESHDNANEQTVIDGSRVNNGKLWWNGVVINEWTHQNTPFPFWPNDIKSKIVGAYTYTRGTKREGASYQGYPSAWWMFDISRRLTVPNTINTNGGIAGNAGRGQGFDAALANGAAAVAGGTNAGASGKSGNGGNWGAQGGTGANGANGNRTNGLAGAVGGLAGFFLNGLANIQFNNLGGTALGRTA